MLGIANSSTGQKDWHNILGGVEPLETAELPKCGFLAVLLESVCFAGSKSLKVFLKELLVLVLSLKSP